MPARANGIVRLPLRRGADTDAEGVRLLSVRAASETGTLPLFVEAVA
jgi:hypothetical protein